MNKPCVGSGPGPVAAGPVGLQAIGYLCCWPLGLCLVLSRNTQGTSLLEAPGLLACLKACCAACVWVWIVPGALLKHAGKRQVHRAA
jgi:hypothetical protein